MMDDGVFCIHRGAFKHPFFADEPYSEREAWFWLLGNAAWKETKVRSGRALVILQRGQLAYATRFLAKKWKWSEARVRRFLNRLESEAMIVAQATRQTTQITICNYDEYQFQRRTSDAQNDAVNDAQATHERRKEEEDNKRRIDIVREPVKRTTEKDDRFLEFYSAYPRRQSKQDAIKAYAQVRKGGVSHETIMAGLDRAKRGDSRFRDQRFTPLPASWLRAGGFEDEATGGAQQQDWKQAVFS